jgi:hypothetical protein
VFGVYPIAALRWDVGFKAASPCKPIWPGPVTELAELYSQAHGIYLNERSTD